MRLRTPALALLAAVLLAGAAPDPSDRLADPAQEARARHLFQTLRCVVCQNESLDDSQADLASDLRRIIRQQIAAGRSDSEVRAFLVQRYGQFILLQPPLWSNAALWGAPFLVLLLGGAYLWRRARAPLADVEAMLTPEEEIALAALEAGPEQAQGPNTDEPAGAAKIERGR